jgi:hypothetical protein
MWKEGKYCLSRRVLAGRFVLKIEMTFMGDHLGYLDGMMIGGPWKTLEEAQRGSEEIVKGLLRNALDSLSSS